VQILSGTAKVLSSNVRRVQFSGMTGADAALLASGQAFKFQGETLLFFTVSSVISVSPTPEIELVSPGYNGAQPLDQFFPYLIWKDFAPIRGLKLFSPNDVDIRDGLTSNFNIIDPLLGGGSGSLTASGLSTVTAGDVSKIITGTFPSGGAYKVLVTPNWLTAYSARAGSKSTTQFILDFSVPAPAGADVNWAVVA
jgi:hypothetical protein